MLKLPKQVSFSTGTTVSYQYDATGKKLKMSLSNGDSRDYVGPVEYLNSNLLAIRHPEGRLAQGTTYEYFLTDHLGNIRAVATNSGVTQWTEYDPWGMEISALSSGTSTNRDKFNGKEALAEIGNGMLDYGARLYDATIGRWGLIDPLAEKATHWSPYRFGFDNPVSVTDPTGMFEYSNGYTTQDSKDITGAMEFNGVFQNGGGDGPGVSVNQGVSRSNQLEGPGKGQTSTSTTQSNSSQQASAAVGLAGAASSLGRSTGTSTLSRLLNGLGRFLSSGLGTVASLPFIVEGDVTSQGNEERPITLYRGVHVGHPDYPNALKGKAIPWGINGGHQDPEAHTGGNLRSIFTSWSLTKAEAMKHALGNGVGGVVLEKKFYITRDGVIPQTGGWFDDELEYLVPGIVTGAKTQVLK